MLIKLVHGSIQVCRHGYRDAGGFDVGKARIFIENSFLKASSIMSLEYLVESSSELTMRVRNAAADNENLQSTPIEIQGIFAPKWG
jgi:hypothetical protein